MSSWTDALAPSNRSDGYLRMVTALALFLWLWLVGTHLETPYPAALVESYALPLTRIFLLLLVLLAAAWCPTVGILAAFAYITLGADVLFFTRGGEVLASI